MTQKFFGTNVERHYKAGDIRQRTSCVLERLSLDAICSAKYCVQTRSVYRLVLSRNGGLKTTNVFSWLSGDMVCLGTRV